MQVRAQSTDRKLTTVLPKDALIKPYKAKVYALYNIPTITQDEDGLLSLHFACAKPGCKLTGPIPRKEHRGGSNKGSTGRLLEHARACWGKEKVAEVLQAQTAEEAADRVRRLKQGKLTVYFENARGKGEIEISVRNQAFEELWCVPDVVHVVLIMVDD